MSSEDILPKQRKIVDYKIIDESQPGTLGLNVHNHIKDGWQPFGHPFHIHDKDYFYILQPMVKYED